MPETESQLRRIQEKLQQLVRQHQVLQKENQRLKEELQMNTKAVLVHQQHVDDLKQQVSVLKLTTGNYDEGEKKELEKRLSLYVKEIDRCIAMLSQ